MGNDGRIMGDAWHLVRRFFAALPNRGPDETDRAWVESVLSTKEYELWARQYPPDRRHSALIARQVERRLDDSGNWVLASALLHDVGKIEADLGTWGRVFATVAAKIIGSARVRQWTVHDGCRGRLGSYLNHPEIGAELLRRAQSDPRTVAWVAEHHKGAHEWTIPAEIAQVLHEFDND